jgi:large subunit ribosomal protein L4
MKAPLYTKDGHKKKEVVLNPKIYAARVNQRLLELVKNAYAANLRHGTASTKKRCEVQGGGKKPWKQKGTGRARHSSTRSPIWVGGGIAWGPRPRSYYVALPNTMRRQALISALSLRGGQKKLMVLEDLKVASPKTKEWVEILKALHIQGKRALCVVKEIGVNLKRASRNVSRIVEVVAAKDLNAYHVLQQERILLEEDALPVIEARVLGSASQSIPTEKTKDNA